MAKQADDQKRKDQKNLIAALKDKQPSDYRYFFKTFEGDGEQAWMIANFRNDTSCFDIRIFVDKWDKLAGMRAVNGTSYPKELYDLKWVIATVDGAEAVKYLDMHRIID